tara:strand:- start:53005 stop:53595 length:591 start_codon:yes stop_codon:yes gene_type:complete
MKSVGYFKKIILIGVCGILASCITVNVNFPEAAVQKAADDYVKELYKAKQESEEKQNTSSLFEIPGTHFASLSLFPIAHAQAEFSIKSEKAKAIQVKQAKRLDKIDRFKKKGLIGEAENGLLVVKKESSKKIEKKRVDQLVSEENADREMLYEEVMSSNGIDASQSARLRKSFHQSFVNASPAGTPVESGGSWTNK